MTRIHHHHKQQSMAPIAVNKFSATITGGCVPRGADANMVALDHGQQYSVKVRNGHRTRARFTLSVDGKKQGQWVIPAGGEASFDRPAKVAKRFTFFADTSGEAAMAGATPGASTNGLVECAFVAELAPQPFMYEEDDFDAPVYRSVPSGFRGARCSESRGEMRADDRCGGGVRSKCKRVSSACRPSVHNVTSGVTGLQGHSSQRFGTARAIDPDHSTSTTISFRLVCANSWTAIEPLPDSRPHSTTPVVIAPPPPVPSYRPVPSHVVGHDVFPLPEHPSPSPRQPFPSYADEVKQLLEMGFTDEKLCLRYLWTSDGNVQQAAKGLIALEREDRAKTQATFEKEVADIVYMGFEHDAAMAALKESGDVKAAVKQLMAAERINAA